MVIQLEDGRAQHRPTYEWHSGAVTINDGSDSSGVTTNLNASTGFTTLFNDLEKNRAHHIKIEVASGNLYIRLNKSTANVITVTSTSPYEKDMTVTAIFASTNNSAVTITISLN